ncbi:MAG: hypothetical protein A2V67_18090 [Deltaproteobacteria bacterium RBG_13_61_14]|nr:MAG: hypothetical protein A2V67_18090 [Deltaproteobacteria bacterium RBG_13_61_14]
MEIEKREMEARWERLELPVIHKEMLSFLVAEFEEVMASDSNHPPIASYPKVNDRSILIDRRRAVLVHFTEPGFGSPEGHLALLEIYCSIYCKF